MNTLIITILSLLNLIQFNKNNQQIIQNNYIIETELIQKHVPLFTGSANNILFELVLKMSESINETEISHLVLNFQEESQLSAIASISASLINETQQLSGKSSQISWHTKIPWNYKLTSGNQKIQFNFESTADANLSSCFQLENIGIVFKNDKTLKVVPETPVKYHLAKKLRTAGQDNCHTYRIPGLITTNSGTLIAVYDNRYNNSKDLQEDIDIGMSRSTDGGQNWEPMKVIMDMGEWGGRSQQLNGIGDPCILYDHVNHTIWVTALWMSGAAPNEMLWWASKPGMKAEETGQFILAKSTDDGQSWSQPINITEQIKDPVWQLLLQGPGKGICTKNGSLVFPAQFKADIGKKSLDGGQFTCHSTIVYSEDAGLTWKIGTGAKSNTTESQVVELSNGDLMLNMRDDRNRKDKGDTNGRAVAITSDMGKTWTSHVSSNSALPESNCMASLISADLEIDGTMQQVLFFSNPNNKYERKNMTIKASFDGGVSWSEEYQLLLNEEGGYGYSCMTMIDQETIGILYEGVRELYFQKIKIKDIINEKIN